VWLAVYELKTDGARLTADLAVLDVLLQVPAADVHHKLVGRAAIGTGHLGRADEFSIIAVEVVIFVIKVVEHGARWHQTAPYGKDSLRLTRSHRTLDRYACASYCSVDGGCPRPHRPAAQRTGFPIR